MWLSPCVFQNLLLLTKNDFLSMAFYQNYTILMQSCYSKLVTCKLYYITNYLLKLWNCILNIFNHNNYDYMTCKYISTLYKIIID